MTTQINLLPLVTLAVSASQDGDLSIPIAFKKADGSPVDLTGISFGLILKASAASATIALNTAAGPYILNSGTSGVVTVAVPQSRWAKVFPGAYVGDLVATADGLTVVVGAFAVTQAAIGGCQITSFASAARNAATAGSVGYIPGPGWNQYRGDYSGATGYVANDVVYYAFSSWIALGPTTGNAPAVGSAYWHLVALGVDPNVVSAAIALTSRVSAVEAVAAAAAPNASPALTGAPTAPTPGSTDNSQRLATTAFVQQLIALLINSAPGALDTLAEIDAAINNDPNFATTVMTALGTKAKAGANTDITSLTGLTTALAVPYGGTGQTTYVVGDILFASATNALSRLPGVATGNALLSGGVGAAPSWGKIDLTAHVTARLAAANMFQAPAGTLRGNLTTAQADVVDSSLSAHMDAAFGTTQGTLLCRGSSGWSPLAAGAAGQPLTSNGPGSTPSYQAPNAAASTPNVSSFAGLKIAPGATAASQVTVTADSLILKGSSVGMVVQGVSVTASTGTTGANGLDTGTIAANTWYAIHVINNGSTTACLLSTSATAPTMPSGYTYRSRVGWIRTNGSSQLIGIVQYGRRAQYVVDGSRLTALPLVASNIGGVLVSTSLATTVPSTAGSVRLVLAAASNTNGASGAAPNANYSGGPGDATNPTPLANFSVSGAQSQGEIGLETPQQIYAYAQANAYIRAVGWEDNL